MILLDTVALMRLALGHGMARAAMQAISQAQAARSLLISTVSIWEIETLSRRTGRTALTFVGDPAAWVASTLERVAATVIAFDAEDAMALFDLPVMHADPADRMLVATARRRDIPLVSDDRKLVSLGEQGDLRLIVC